MINVTKAEYYPWYKNTDSRYPWSRYRDIEFLKSEIKRIKDTRRWYDEYLKLPEGSKLEEVTYYVIPIKLSPGWIEAAHPVGKSNVKGLSALRNDLQVPLLALFPNDMNLPPDYTLIRITSPTKRVLFNAGIRGRSIGQYAIAIEDFEVLPADYLYKDVRFDKKLLSEVLHSHFGRNKFVSKQLEMPLMSSPFVINHFGGVGLASLMNESSFVKKILKRI